METFEAFLEIYSTAESSPEVFVFLGGLSSAVLLFLVGEIFGGLSI